MKKGKLLQKIMALMLSAAVSATVLTGCETMQSTKKVTTITLWNYYNGTQMDSFNELVDEFNETVGKEKRIEVKSYSQGSVNDLETNVRNAAEGKVGAEPLPDIFSAYADTAYYLDHMGLVADLTEYLTEDELSRYISGYLKEGDIDGKGSLKIFPIAKSTELLFLNDTDWETFAQATGTKYSELSTIEGLVQVAKRYYEWTDAKTEAPDDGKAFFGRDAMANYMFLGAEELGDSIFTVGEKGKMKVVFQESTARKLWDNYYVPYVKGYFSAAGRFRSDDVKTGNVLAYVGSTSSATFFPKNVESDSGESHEISMKVLSTPKFENCEKHAVQQGAGMVVTKQSEEHMKASVEFLKWFTKQENNIIFSVESGYLPVTYEANDMDLVRKSGVKLTKNMEELLETAMKEVTENALYTPTAFSKGKETRNVLEYTMSDLATADRETVKQRLADGMSIDEAAAEFLTEEYFLSWYRDMMEQLKAYES